MKTMRKWIVYVAFFGASSFALAVPINGDISFSSQFNTNFTYDTDTNTLDFDADVPQGSVNAVSGDFIDYFMPGDLVTFYDFTYDPFSGPVDLWSGVATVGANSGKTLVLAMKTLTVDLEGNRVLALTGTGTLSDGTSTTNAYWNLTANQGVETFSWSSSAFTVPEPGTIALLGLGLLGLGATRRRKA